MPTEKQLHDLADEALADAGEWKRRACVLLFAIKPLAAMFSPHPHCGCAACNARAAIALVRSTDEYPQDAAARALLAALEGVVRVADRATVEFDAARAAIAQAKAAGLKA